MQDISAGRFTFDYESSASASYLVIKTKASEKIIGYQVEMIANNSIGSVLHLDVRRVDDSVNIFYNITSKLPLTRFLKRRKLKRDEMIDILSSVSKVILEGINYMLSDRSFLLDEEYVFINPDTLEVFLVYIPIDLSSESFPVTTLYTGTIFSEHSFENATQPKVETYSYLKVDSNSNIRDFVMRLIMFYAEVDDDSSDNFLQRIINHVKSEVFNTSNFYELLKELKTQNTPESDGFTVQKNEKPVKALSAVSLADTAFKPVQPPAGAVSAEVPPRAVKIPPPLSGYAGKKDIASVGLKYKRPAVIAAVISQIAIAAVLAVLFISGALKELGDDTVTTYGLVILVAGALDFLILKRLLDKKNRVENEYSGQMKVNNGENYRLNVFKREIRSQQAGQSESRNEKSEEYADYEVQVPLKYPGKVQHTDETTLLADDNSVNGSGSKYPYLQCQRDGVIDTIHITRDCFVIGRLKDQTDYVLQNSAVGKVHAEIVSREGRYFIRDLNSRNGTYVNEVRIDSNREYEMKGGEKLSFANSEYTFIIP